MLCFFFFKQKTAYEMRISDWSSDVCSSDLLISRMAAICDRYDLLVSGAATGNAMDPAAAMRLMMAREGAFDDGILARFQEALGVYRSEERRVGKECVQYV